MANWTKFKEWGTKYDPEGNKYRAQLKIKGANKASKARVRRKEGGSWKTITNVGNPEKNKWVWKAKGWSDKVSKAKGKIKENLKKWPEKKFKLYDSQAQAASRGDIRGQASIERDDGTTVTNFADMTNTEKESAYEKNFGFNPLPVLTPEKIASLQDKPQLSDYLNQLGYTDNQVGKIYAESPPPFFQLDPQKLEMAEEDLAEEKEQDVYQLRKEFSPAYMKAKSTATSGLLLGEEEEKMEDIREDLVEGQQRAFEQRQRGFEKDIYGLQSEAGQEFKTWLEETMATVTPDKSLQEAG